jgi:tRNA-2-methylthio-N6-dimethylallyladenosine synthase
LFRFSGFTGERAEGYRAWVTIIKGCSNNCSYCIVPHLRGPEISKKSEDIYREVKDLAAKGVIEITLLGQNVNAYGKDNGDISFIELLEVLHSIESIIWIRFLTSHPKDFSIEIIRKISHLPKVCKHIHLPVQSGSDRILALMNRKYTIAHYTNLVEGIRKFIPGASITTDIIVGFPTETEEDFQKTLSIVRDCTFDDAFTYRYSTRPFTKAAVVRKKVPAEISKRRLEELIVLQRGITFEKNKREIGKRTEVLVERESKKNKFEFLCKTDTGKMVVVKTKAPIGTFIKVEVNGISGNTLRGIEIN